MGFFSKGPEQPRKYSTGHIDFSYLSDLDPSIEKTALTRRLFMIGIKPGVKILYTAPFFKDHPHRLMQAALSCGLSNRFIYEHEDYEHLAIENNDGTAEIFKLPGHKKDKKPLFPTSSLSYSNREEERRRKNEGDYLYSFFCDFPNGEVILKNSFNAVFVGMFASLSEMGLGAGAEMRRQANLLVNKHFGTIPPPPPKELTQAENHVMEQEARLTAEILAMREKLERLEKDNVKGTIDDVWLL